MASYTSSPHSDVVGVPVFCHSLTLSLWFSNENNVIKIIKIISNLTSVIYLAISIISPAAVGGQVCCHLLTPSVKNQWSNICECLLYNVYTVLQHKRLRVIHNKVKLNTTFKCFPAIWEEPMTQVMHCITGTRPRVRLDLYSSKMNSIFFDRLQHIFGSPNLGAYAPSPPSHGRSPRG